MIAYHWRCFRCGECCRASACGFGSYDHAAQRCEYLVPTKIHPNFVEYGCAIHDEIVKDPTSVCSPAFGAGCCRTLFNEPRAKIMAALKEKRL